MEYERVTERKRERKRDREVKISKEMGGLRKDA